VGTADPSDEMNHFKTPRAHHMTVRQLFLAVFALAASIPRLAGVEVINTAIYSVTLKGEEIADGRPHTAGRSFDINSSQQADHVLLLWRSRLSDQT
jgi:hypothetical protein